VVATIKRVRSSEFGARNKFVVEKTIDRENLWEIQTPQVFKAKLILGAYRKFGRANVTDDAMLVEKAGSKVAVVPGSYNNIKITTPEDLIAAEAIAKSKKFPPKADPPTAGKV
jgi:2-C-methyl-D-erythritol 4-phosphate cytidylyltransferase